MKRTTSQVIQVFALFLAIILFAGCGGSSDPEPYSAAIAEARTAAREAMAESEASALTLALVDGERVIWTESLEHAKGTGIVTGPEVMFGIGSVSKMFATIAVMKLVERGKVSLDEPLVTYLPDFSMLSPQYRDITVRMLLNHSAGFPGGDLRNGLTAAPFTGFAAQVMESMKFQRLKHAPGYLSVYSNDGFTMVENLVKAVTGISYPDFVQQEILTPLGMTNSRYPTELLPDGSYARPYTGETVQPYTSLNIYATGALYATATDMGKLAMMLINGGLHGSQRILSAASIAAMAQDQTLSSFNPLPSDRRPLRPRMGHGRTGRPQCRRDPGVAEGRVHRRGLRDHVPGNHDRRARRATRGGGDDGLEQNQQRPRGEGRRAYTAAGAGGSGAPGGNASRASPEPSAGHRSECGRKKRVQRVSMRHRAHCTG